MNDEQEYWVMMWRNFLIASEVIIVCFTAYLITELVVK